MRQPILRMEGEPDTQFFMLGQPIVEQMLSDLLKIPNSVTTTYNPTDSWWMDDGYYAFPIEKFKDILELWHKWLSLIHYITDVFDCDDYAFLFKEFMALCGYNSAGVLIGEITDLNTNQFLGYHAWNVILFINQQGVYKVMEFEPQLDDFVMNHVSYDKFGYRGEWIIW